MMNNLPGPRSWRGCASALGMALCVLGGGAGILYAVNRFVEGIMLALVVLMIGILVLWAALRFGR